MPASDLSQEFQLETRDRYSHVTATVSIKVDGRELPNLAILGEALDAAIELIKAKVKEAYTVVPPRPVETPVAQPYSLTNNDG